MKNANLKGDTQTQVLTPQAKQVTSDARLHLEKIKRQNKAPKKQVIATGNVDVDEELHRLDIKRRILIEKVR